MALGPSMEEWMGEKEGCRVTFSQLQQRPEPTCSLELCANPNARKRELLHCLQRAEMREREASSSQFNQR